MEELESLIVIIIRVSRAPAGSTIGTWRKRKNLKKKIKRSTRGPIRTRAPDSPDLSIDEEFEDCMLVAGGSPRTCGRP